MEHQTGPDVTDAQTAAPRLTIRLVLREAVQRLFDVDRGWLRTVRELTVGPGAMIRRYVEGHRTFYTNPFAYLVVGSAVNFVV